MNVSFFKEEKRKRKQQQAVPKKQKTTKINISDKVRYNEFHVTAKFRLIREGISLDVSPDSIREQLTEEHLYHFVNPDIYIDRSNPHTPKYIGVFRVHDRYYHPLLPDLKQVYSNRTNKDMCWELMEETPYWVDVYAIKKSKKRP